MSKGHAKASGVTQGDRYCIARNPRVFAKASSFVRRRQVVCALKGQCFAGCSVDHDSIDGRRAARTPPRWHARSFQRRAWQTHEPPRPSLRSGTCHPEIPDDLVELLTGTGRIAEEFWASRWRRKLPRRCFMAEEPLPEEVASHAIRTLRPLGKRSSRNMEPTT